MDTETGELQERRLQHPEEAEKFYRELAAQGMSDYTFWLQDGTPPPSKKPASPRWD